MSMTPDPMTARWRVDSLTANEFEVQLDGERVTGVFRVSGLSLTARGAQPGAVTLSKMVQRDTKIAFNRWLIETADTPTDQPAPARNLAVVAMDDGKESRRWTLINATIIAVNYSDFDSASGDLVEEVITFACERIEVAWSAMPDTETPR